MPDNGGACPLPCHCEPARRLVWQSASPKPSATTALLIKAEISQAELPGRFLLLAIDLDFGLFDSGNLYLSLAGPATAGAGPVFRFVENLTTLRAHRHTAFTSRSVSIDRFWLILYTAFGYYVK